MTPKPEQQNKWLAELSAKIGGLEIQLDDLYEQRRGRIQWNDDDTCHHGWCVNCGKYWVSPDSGEDTCVSCLKSL